MAKKAIVLDTVTFQHVISTLEKENNFSSRSALWKAVEETTWAKTCVPRPLTSQVAMLKAQEFKLTINTPLGRRGAVKGEVRHNKRKVSLSLIDDVKVPDKYNSLLERLKKGSLKAAIKLKCLECSCWVSKEVGLCKVNACPLFPVRPFQKG